MAIVLCLLLASLCVIKKVMIANEDSSFRDLYISWTETRTWAVQENRCETRRKGIRLRRPSQTTFLHLNIKSFRSFSLTAFLPSSYAMPLLFCFVTNLLGLTLSHKLLWLCCVDFSPDYYFDSLFYRLALRSLYHTSISELRRIAYNKAE